MELQFQNTPLRCLRCSATDSVSVEQTLELRVGEGLPPVGRVLGAWGQPLIRGKEWRGDHVRVNGGVMARTLYEAEDGAAVACVEGWIPFQLSWDLSDSKSDGKMIVNCQLRSMDARQISAEKLMVRASVSAFGQALEREEYPVYSSANLPADIYTRQVQYPVCVPAEAGETTLMLDEDVMLPPGKTGVEKILFYHLTPAVHEKKLMADKMLYRGTALLHVGYLGEDGMLHAYDTEIPISQYGELEREYGPEATARIEPIVSDLELEQLEEGRFRLKAGLVGQYVIYDRPMLQVVQDAYSNQRPVQIQTQQVKLPMVLEERVETIPVRKSINVRPERMVDCGILAGQPRVRQGDEGMEILMEGASQLLYYDGENRPQCVVTPFEERTVLPVDNSVRLHSGMLSTGRADAVISGEDTIIQAEPRVWVQSVQPEGITMVTGLTVGDDVAADPGRPSLILRRAGDLSLWDLAKKCGSTEEAIRTANRLEGEPGADEMLLIPVG